jgi:hypothetical protein
MDNGTLKRELRPLELRDADGRVIETDLRPLSAKDRQNVLWRTVRTKIFIKGTDEEYR